ncbi:MAG: ATP-binding protein, partial [Candidatus Omnitrophica bacterium]|nr:ATP-binding protein [Candidatus Omnitrophota bacterium]
VQIENLNEVKLWAGDENEDFIQCPGNEEWISSDKESFEIKHSGVSKGFGQKYQFHNKPGAYYYAYPTYVYSFVKKETGRRNAIVLPLFIFPVSAEKSPEKITLKRIDDTKPQFNFEVLRKLSFSFPAEQRKAFLQNLLDCWKDQVDSRANLKSLISFILAEVNDGKLKIDDSLSGLALKQIDLMQVESGLYPCGLLFIARRSDFTFGLEEELDDIEKTISSGAPSLPVIESIINRKAIELETKQDSQLVEITPLNDDQRKAVRSAFSKTLTVVTGPPGTGKSQVVLNIIANAVVRGESVLFGSRNNKAVDVVLERMLQIQEQPIILRFGQGSKESLFIEQLLRAVDRSRSLDSKNLISTRESLYVELKRLSEKEDNVWGQIKECYQLRDKIDQIDLVATSILERMPKGFVPILLKEVSKSFDRLNLEHFDKYINNQKNRRPGAVLTIASFLGLSPEKCLKRKILRIINYVWTPEFKEYFLKLLDKELSIFKLAVELHDALRFLKLTSNLQQLRSEESASAAKVSELEGELKNIQKERAVLSPKFVDIFMSEKLKGLSNETRNDISDYYNATKRLEEDIIGGEVARELRKQKERLFASLVKAFPAIAVTNLRVRRAVPLSPAVVDLVVIDEASQCDIASALPMVFRAKRAVIIGDQNQLIHVSDIRIDSDQQIQAKHNLINASEQRFLYSTHSLFDLCMDCIGTAGEYVFLKDHYRSRAEIIEFSNHQFYQGTLEVWTDYRQLKETGDIHGITWHDVKGNVVRPSGGSAFKTEEVDKIVEILASILPKAAAIKANIGIITPFVKQENMIRDKVIQRFDREQLVAVDLRIDAVHGFQGDERDI